jgi:hypothetical protein
MKSLYTAALPSVSDNFTGAPPLLARAGLRVIAAPSRMRFTCGITNSALSPFATVGLAVVRDCRTGSATSSSKTLDVPSSSDSSSSELEDDATTTTKTRRSNRYHTS